MFLVVVGFAMRDDVVLMARCAIGGSVVLIASFRVRIVDLLSLRLLVGHPLPKRCPETGVWVQIRVQTQIADLPVSEGLVYKRLLEARHCRCF